MNDKELMDLLWNERDGTLPEVGIVFANYINEEFTPWDVLDLCSPPSGLSAPTMRNFFEDWIGELMQERPDLVKEMSGWAWDENEKMWIKEEKE